MMPDVVFVLARWIHIASVVTLIGGIVFARLVLLRSLNDVSGEAREALTEKAASLFRPLVNAAMVGLVVSGMFNLLTAPGHPRFYHMLLAIKLLLVLHVFVVVGLVVRPKQPRRTRLLTGTVISAAVILFISAWLRRMG